MEFRYYNNIDPTHVFTVEEVQDMRKRAKHIFDYLGPYNKTGVVYYPTKEGEIVDFDLLNRYDDNTILRLLNEVASNSIKPKTQNDVHYAKHGGSLNYFDYFK